MTNNIEQLCVLLDHWRTKAEVLQAEVDTMKPVVDAVRAYQESQK